MNLKFVLVATLLFCSRYSDAQKNLQPGFVILPEGDTLHGFIDHKEWHKNPSTISFRTTADGQEKAYSKKDIVYFEIHGKESYKLFRVRISMDTRVLAYIPEKKDTTNRVEAVFLRTVFTGNKITLFSFNDESKLRWYIKEVTRDTPEELLNSAYRNGSMIFNEREYRQQLRRLSAAYLPHDSDIIPLINKASYEKKTILKICEKIDGPDSDDLKSGDNSSLRFFAGTGLNSGVISFSGNSRYSGKTSSSLSPLIGGGVDIHIAPNVGRLYLRNTVTFSSVDSEFTSGGYYLGLKQLNFSLHSQLNYNFYNTPELKWFGGAGAGFNLSSYPKNKQIGDYGTITEDYLQTEKIWINMIVQSGLAIRNIEISLCYLPKSDITQYLGFSAKSSSWQLRVNYLFQKRKAKT